MRIALAQLDPVVGAFEANCRKILEAYERACALGARLLATTELAVCGYPPHDLVERPEMFERNDRALALLRDATRGKACALAVGHIARNPAPTGRAAQNVVTVLDKGRQAFRQAKTLLPTYDVFDEARYFEPAREVATWDCDGRKVAVAICEDLWAEDASLGSSGPEGAAGRKLYDDDPASRYRKLGAELVLSLSASPYTMGKRQHREDVHAAVARSLGVPLVYVNQVGATDEVLFDGASFALDSQGKLLGRLPVFRTGFGLLELGGRFVEVEGEAREDRAPDESEVLLRALVTGVKDYFARTGFKTAILGLSGGIDSAVVAALAARALGPENILAVAMPSQISSAHSLEDAELLARKLGLNFEVRPIKFVFSTLSRELSERRGSLAPLALENLQSRLRGTMLMALSNHYDALVLNTGNKSELAMGYCTLYGDMNGAIGPIGDLYKTQVYELARAINKCWGNPIPDRVLTKAPSAELRPNQTDQDSLPPYEVLDPLLIEYVERGTPVSELEQRFEAAGKVETSRPSTHLVVGTPGGTPSVTPFKMEKGWVREILRKLELNEYKRRQAAPVLKVSPKAFGIGRRVPTAKIWDQRPDQL